LTDAWSSQRADSAALPFADGAFEAVTVAFGARNFEDLERGLREMLRVLAPGGRLFVLEFSKPRGSVMGALFRFYFHRVMPAIGRAVSRDSAAYTYLPQSVDAFPDGDEFLRIVARCGGRDARMRRLTGGVATIYHAVR
jgi:demethylmenaquinone methyltransferase/2-methoxy-6-polyprenyl-1,4-benzoquinol methylase